MNGRVNLHLFLSPCTHESRFLKEASSLLAAGVVAKVQLVGLWKPGLPREESLAADITVSRIRLSTRTLGTGLAAQIVKYAEWLLRSVAAGCRTAPGSVHAHSLAALPAAVLVKWLRRVPLVYDAHEYEAERNGLAGLRKTLAGLLERSLIRYADEVLVVSESIADAYRARYGIARPTVLLNCPRYFEVTRSDLFRNTFGLRAEQVIFLYQGNLSPGRGIDILLDCFADMVTDACVIVFMGDGPLRDAIRTRTSRTIFLHPAVAPAELLQWTAAADFGIAFIEDACLSYRYCLPNKLFEYLMAGLPVLVSNLDEMKRLTETEGIGVVAASNTAAGFLGAVEAARRLAPASVAGNLARARKIYNWENQEKILVDVYHALH